MSTETGEQPIPNIVLVMSFLMLLGLVVWVGMVSISDVRNLQRRIGQLEVQVQRLEQR